MGARFVVVGDVAVEYSSEVAFAQNDHMVHTLTANGADDALGIGILPRRPRRFFTATSFQELTTCPYRRRVRGDNDMQYPPTIVMQDHQHA